MYANASIFLFNAAKLQKIIDISKYFEEKM